MLAASLAGRAPGYTSLGFPDPLQALIDVEATTRIGAEPHQRTPDRVAQRNRYRDRSLTTAAGDLELRIPKLRSGSFFLSPGSPPRRW